MRTCLSVRSLAVPPMVIAIVSAFACSESPTQPAAIGDATVVSRSRSFDEPTSFTQPADLIEQSPMESEFLDEELTDASELTDEVADIEELDLNDLGSTELETSDVDVNDLTTTAATTGPESAIVLSGVIKDKLYKRFLLGGVVVKATGAAAVKSDERGRFMVKVRPGPVTIGFTKTGYKKASIRRSFSRSTGISVLLTAIVPPGMTVRCKDQKFMVAKMVTGACSARGGVAYWVTKPAALSSVSLNASSVPVGIQVTGSITLTKAAPSGGVKVLLSSTTSAVEVPASVTVAAGQKTTTFKASAEAAGTSSIKGTYDGVTKSDTLTVTPNPLERIVARFTYGPGDQCEVIANPSAPPPLVATCTLDASSSEAPEGSRYTWTFPGPTTFANRASKTISNVELACGSLPNGVFDRTVYLKITAPDGREDTTPQPVTFKKIGLC